MQLGLNMGVFDEQAAQSVSRWSTNIAALTEVEQYLKVPVINRKEDPLLWWRHV